MVKPTLGILIGSIRPNRFGGKVAPWFQAIAEQRSTFTLEMIDMLTYSQLPLFNEPLPPSQVKDGAYAHPLARELAARIKKCDAFVVITPEYNHSISPALKNGFDYLFAEWNKKPIAAISYGSAGGARAVEHLRGIAIELDMAPIRNAVHIMAPWSLTDESGALKEGALQIYEKSANALLDALLWWTNALVTARR